MPFREKTAWISLVSMAAIYGVYFFSLVQAGPQPAGVHSGALLATVVVLVIVQTVLTIAIAVMKPAEAKAPRDEREKLIAFRSGYFAYSGLATAVALACLFGAFDPPIIFDTNALLFILVVAEIMRSGCQIVQYRRGR